MKHPKCLHAAIALVAICSSLYVNAKDVKVTSPNGKISVLITDAGDRLCYSASLDGEKLFTQTSLMVKLQNKSIGAKTRIKSVKISSVNEELRPTVPLKQANIPNNYTKATLSMRERYSIEFRVFNKYLQGLLCNMTGRLTALFPPDPGGLEPLADSLKPGKTKNPTRSPGWDLSNRYRITSRPWPDRTGR